MSRTQNIRHIDPVQHLSPYKSSDFEYSSYLLSFTPIPKMAIFPRNLFSKSTLSNANRTSFHHAQWKPIRLKLVAQTAAGGIAFMLWFLACCSYLFGTLYMSPSRHDKFHVLAVDYDGGVVGDALLSAYKQLESPEFFTLDIRGVEEYGQVRDLERAVWEGQFWGAIAVMEGASERLAGR